MGEQLYSEIGEQFVEQHRTTISQMFGKPCLKAGSKAFAAFFNGDMVFKLGEHDVNLLKAQYTNSVNWDPSGKKRPMKDWLQIPVEFKDDWRALAQQALEYVTANA